MKVIDSGHDYELATLDGGFPQRLTFVKRHSVEDPMKFPGNTESHPGTTLQNVIRATLERFRYLHRQIWAVENLICIGMLRLALWLLEFRAARRHGRTYFKSLRFAETEPMCIKCGHTVCNHKINGDS
jgi:hypothetical protein